MATNWLFLVRSNFSEEYVAVTTMGFQELIGLNSLIDFRECDGVCRGDSHHHGGPQGQEGVQASLRPRGEWGRSWSLPQEKTTSCGSPLPSQPAPSPSLRVSVDAWWPAPPEQRLRLHRRLNTRLRPRLVSLPLGIFQFLMWRSDWQLLLLGAFRQHFVYFMLIMNKN